MASSRLVTLTTILSIFIVIEGSEQNKPGAIQLCGYHFLEAWYECCEMGYQTCTNYVPSSHEGSIEALLKRGYPLIPSKVAKSFLGTMTKRDDWGEDNGEDNTIQAVEECCNEGCSYREIAEYPCHGTTT